MGQDGKKSKKHKREEREYEDPKEREERKAKKKAEKVAKMLGYSNDVNPFGDSNLLQPFIWGKKKEKDKVEGKADVNMHSDGKRLELIGEIEKVRKRRKEREDELEEMDRLRGEEQRLREASQYGDWMKKEEDFHLNQTRERSKIRLVEKRETPVDLIAKNILLIEAANIDEKSREYDARNTQLLLELDVELRNPVELVEELYEDELKQLVTDTECYLELERRKTGKESYTLFWQSLLFIAIAQLRKVRKGSSSSSSDASRPHDSVSTDIQRLLEGKSHSELENLQSDIEKSIRDGASADVEYWEQMQQEVKVQLARAYVNDTHITLLQKQLEMLSALRVEARERRLKDALLNPKGKSAEEERAELEIQAAVRSLDDDTADKPLGDKEEKMQNQDEVLLPGSTYWWQDKYRPRKPRYLNRVKTGWDWNKYNSTHYDYDNPPPKVIQGYKFTLFYPDLIDKTKTPQYIVEPCTDGNDFVIIRFHSGPPYEDVAFKIINKQWDVHRKSGFRCIFERGVLQVHFNFMRSFYRR